MREQEAEEGMGEGRRVKCVAAKRASGAGECVGGNEGNGTYGQGVIEGPEGMEGSRHGR